MVFLFCTKRWKLFWTHCCWKVENAVENKKETVWFQLVRWTPYGFTVYRKITQRVAGFVLCVFFQIRTGSEGIRFLCEWVLFCKKEKRIWIVHGGEDFQIRCKVYFGMTEREEALLFAQQTGISERLSAGQKLRALIFAGEPAAVAFQQATELAGVHLSFEEGRGKQRISV